MEERREKRKMKGDIPTSYLTRPAAESRPAAYMFFLCFFIYILFLPVTIPVNPIILIDKFFRIGRTMAVDDQSEISFSISQETLLWQPNFVGFTAWVSLDAGG